jgi:hypothetical protein
MLVLLVLLADLQASSLAGHGLDGPYPSLKAACEAKRPRDWPDMPCHLTPPIERCTDIQPIAFAGGEARIVRISYECMLAIHHGGKWWLQDLAWVAGDRHYVSIDKLEVRGRNLLVRYETSFWWHEGDPALTAWESCAPSVMACSTTRCLEWVYGFAARCHDEGMPPTHPEWSYLRKLQIGDGWLELTEIPVKPVRAPRWLKPPPPPAPGRYRLP